MDARTKAEIVFLRMAAAFAWTDAEIRQEYRARFGTEYTATFRHFSIDDTATASAGTPEKIELMRKRCGHKQQIFQPHDPWLNSVDREVMEADRQSNGRDVNRRVHAYSWEDEEAEDLLDCDPQITERLRRIDSLLERGNVLRMEARREHAEADAS